MENGGGETQKWNFKGNKSLSKAAGITVRGVLDSLMENLNPNDNRQFLPLGHGDPSRFPCFYTSPAAEHAIVQALHSRQFNCYSSTAGILPARNFHNRLLSKVPLFEPESPMFVQHGALQAQCFIDISTSNFLRAVAEYLSQHLPNKLCSDDVFLTLGCTHAIEVALSVLSTPGANILIPRPGFPYYESMSANTGLEICHFNLLPEMGWEVDLDTVEALTDENTVAMVIINPGNPCGNVYTYEHLQKVAETAKKLEILVIADEVYEHLTFGNNSFIPMGVFSNIFPVMTLGSISKRWVVPGWRVGWLVINNLQGVLQKSGLVDSIKDFLNISSDPVTFIQGALPQIFKNTDEEFFSKIKKILRQGADCCYEKVKDIPCLTCPSNPEGSMFAMVKLELSLLSDIQNDVDFCMKLANEENMVILPGSAVGMENWLRITFAVEPSILEEGLERVKVFSLRHTK